MLHYCLPGSFRQFPFALVHPRIFTMGVYVNEILYPVASPVHCILQIFLFKNEKRKSMLLP